jgi:pyruvate kinase
MKNLPKKKTKVVCTIGPASDAQEVLEQMIRNGMNIARLNFAHGDPAGHERIIQNIRAAAARVEEQVTIMGDLPGPKMRIGRLAEEPLELVRGQSFILQTDAIQGDNQRVSISFSSLPDVVNPGDRIYINDGFIQLEVTHIKDQEIHCLVQVGGELRSCNGVNIPGVDLGICAFTDRDREFLEFAKEHGVDAISQSFVQEITDIQAVRDAAAEIGYDPFIIAKIERNIAGKPVITATHMLESMVENSRPTRAEATDVANAILDGTDCVMLSGETALGKFPDEAVDVMTRIACVTEPHSFTRGTAEILEAAKHSGDISTEDLISLSIFLSVEVINPVAVITPTMSGATARRVCRFRLPVWIIAVSPNQSTCKDLGFSYGVYPIFEHQRPESWARYARDVLTKFNITGELALLTKGTSAAQKIGTNEMEIIDLTSPEGREVIW